MGGKKQLCQQHLGSKGLWSTGKHVISSSLSNFRISQLNLDRLFHLFHAIPQN